MEATFNPPQLPTFVPTGLATAVSTPLPTPKNNVAAELPPPTITPQPIATTTVTQLPTSTPTATLTPTPISPCSKRIPQDDLFTIVTQTYGLSREYAPQDLVLLTDYLPVDVTLGFPTELRQIALQPLIQMIADMQSAGLQPRILSGYRSYAAQAISWDKWNREEPERAAILSARPGHSEHQLGTTVDFGSPELAGIVGIPDIQFHTYFYQTSEGVWLAQNAHRYGFTLSYPRGALEMTGFYYEPWHFRYVGEEMATLLLDLEMYLTEYQLLNQPEPCIP
ncbi:M15 family metallopeptidase [Candidatus Leptofilum sp.]|uniref:M15 family metallopeptidase n=1 Tax=Candidatus Leptofilum sp. TaxID=3241576 RepID=UPI003B5C9814